MFFPPRREPVPEPYPDAWLRHLHDNVFLYRLLSDEDQAKLRAAVWQFVPATNWEGCRGLTITDEIKVTVAGQACLLVLGLEDYCFEDVRTVLVYPGGFLASDPRHEAMPGRAVDGLAHHRGPVVLSWWKACWEGRLGITDNVVLHEFAHKLAEQGDPDAGRPPIEDDELEERWKEVMRAEYEQLCEDVAYERPTLLRPYGASNRAEFFAVTTECFFLQPVALRRRHPALYGVLAGWYRQDPAGRRTPDAAERAWTEAARKEYDARVLAEYDAAVRLQPRDLDSYGGRADYLLSLGEYDRAIADYSTVIRLLPGESRGEALCDRGLAYRDKGDLGAALADFDEAIRRWPRYARAWCERGTTHAERGDYKQALADLTEARRLDPRDDGACIERGRVYYELGQFHRAIRDFTTAIRLYPHAASVYCDRALARCALGDYEPAAADCDEALRLDPELPEAWEHRGAARYHLGAFEEAVADCTEAIRLDPEYGEAYRTRALAHAARGDSELARQDDARADELDSRDGGKLAPP